MFRDSTRYNSVARLLHWVMALLILGNFVGGWLMTHEGVPEAYQFSAFQLHKSFGFIVLILAIVRFFWRVAYRTPPHPYEMPAWEKLVASLTHIAFYVLMIGIPLVGWFYVSATPLQIPTKIFFTIPVPNLPVPVDGELAEIFSGLHEFLAFATIGLFALHVSAAAKHHFINRDSVLTRMAGSGFGPLIALAFAASATAAIVYSMITFKGHEEGEAISEVVETTTETQVSEQSSAEASGEATMLEPAVATGPNAWQIIPDETWIEVEAFAHSAPRHARMDDIQGAIELNLEAPTENDYIDVLIGTRSFASDDNMVRMQGVSAGWLNTPRFPQAHFRSDRITRTEDGQFQAEGALTIRAITAPVTLIFTVTEDGTIATATGEARFDRLAFELGETEPQNTEAIVTLHVSATRD